ncbi:MAG: universal stress protein [Acidimicrobiia bacterium]|nr:universal stress protein [Acidimicrobiia bacterium]
MADSIEAQGEAAHLLVMGDDGSTGADVAWLWVCNHRWPGWRAEVVTADRPRVPAVASAPAVAEEWESPHPRLLTAHSELASVRALTVARDQRLALNDRSDADLLVVGPHNQGRVRTMLLGSTTEWLLHHPSAPIAVIRSATPVRRVLVTADGSAHARAALGAFCRLPWASQTEALVLGVSDGWSQPGDAVEGAVAELDAAGVKATGLVAEGRVTRKILDHIDELDAQLVVLGTRGLSGWDRLRLGSTASAVARGARCSCLVACVD